MTNAKNAATTGVAESYYRFKNKSNDLSWIIFGAILNSTNDSFHHAR
jgi:hypothetical protein